MGMADFFYSKIYLVNTDQFLKHPHFASLSGEGTSAQTELTSRPDQSHHTVFQFLTTMPVLMSENRHLNFNVTGPAFFI